MSAEFGREWDAGPGPIQEPFDRLGPHTQRLLRRAWALTPWTPSDKRVVVAFLLRAPALTREAASAAADGAFVPEAPIGYEAAGFVTVTDLGPHRLLPTLRRFLDAHGPLTSSPSSADERDPDVGARAAPATSPAWPEPRTRDEAARRAAVAYFGGRLAPFTLEEIAEFFGVSTHTVQRWRRDLGLRCFVRGGVTRISVEEAHRLVLSQTV